MKLAVVLLLSAVAFVVSMDGRRRETRKIPGAEASTGPRHAPEFLDRADWIEPLPGRTPVTSSADPDAPESHWQGSHLFAVFIRVRDGETGERVRVDPSVWGQGPAYRFLDPEIAEKVQAIDLGELLPRLGLEPGDIHRRDDNLVAYSMPDAHFDRLGPMLYEIAVPGYLPIYTDQVYLERVGEGDMAELTLFTIPMDGQWGSLRIHWGDRGPLATRRLETDRGIGELYLMEPEAGRLKPSAYVMIHLPLTDERVEHLPARTYMAQFRSSDWPYEYPLPGSEPLLVDVPANGEALVELSAANTGALVIELPEGIEGGAWFVANRNAAVRASEWTSQEHQPFTFLFLQPGDYALTMTDCRRGLDPWTEWKGPVVDIVVGANELARWPYPVGAR